MEIDPREGGWVRARIRDAEVAFRLDVDRLGRLYVAAESVEWVTDRPCPHCLRTAAVEVSMWANGPGAVTVRPEVLRRREMPDRERNRIDLNCLLEPSRRVRWGLGRQAQEEQDTLVDLVLDVPSGRFKPDEFYVAVAARIAMLEESGERAPAARVAAANTVDVDVVYAWMNEARRRGIVPRRFTRTGLRGKAAADA